MSRRLLLLACILALTGAMQLAARVALAQAPAVTLTVTPAALSLAPGETAETLVVASIPLTSVQAITLTHFADAAVSVTITAPVRAQPRGAQAWSVGVARLDSGRSSGKLTLRADYISQDASGAQIPGVVVTTLDIQERVPTTLDKLLRATIELALDPLKDSQTRPAYLVLTNLADVPIQITAVSVQAPDFIQPTVQLPAGGLDLQPQQARPVTVALFVTDAVRPGKHLLLAQVDAAWDKSGQHSTGSLVLTKEFQAGALGESELLTAAGIPSFLFLPGLLFVVVLGWLWSAAWPKWELVPLDIKNPKFWVLAICIALASIFIYPLLSAPILSFFAGRPVSARNYLEGYGLIDIVYVWVGSILAALGLWVAAYLISRAIRLVGDWYRQMNQDRYLATDRDDALTILTKLANNKRGYALQKGIYTEGNETQPVYLLPTELGGDKNQVWIVPPIAPVWKKEDRLLKRAFVEQAKNYGDTGALVSLVRGWGRDVLALEWANGSANAPVRQPRLVARTTVAASGGQEAPFQ